MGINNHYSSQTASVYSGPTPQTGVLSVFVQQTSDESPSYQGGDTSIMRYRAVFKGPYFKAKDFNDMVGKPLMGCLASMPATFDQNFTFPALPGDGDFVWVIKSTRVEQSEAGDHCLLYCDCEAESSTSTQPDESGWVEDPMSNNWAVKWQAYTMEPYAFCTNELHDDRNCPDPAVDKDTILSGPAMREHVMKFIETKDNGILNEHRWYRDDDGQAKYLNYHEQLVCNKVVKNKRAQYHYPVLTHVTVKRKMFPDVSSVINDHTMHLLSVGLSVDYIIPRDSSELSGCPFDFPSEYVWVKQGDDLARDKETNPPAMKFTRTETYWGVISADVNFYGHLKWDENDNTLSISRWTPDML